jgi:hypothetical protein
MTGTATAELRQQVAAELAGPAMPAALALARAICAERGDGIAAILFYGSCLRTGDTSGVLDFYVLVDDLRRHYGAGTLARATRLLPPTISFVEAPWDGGTVRAKVATLALDQFRAAVRPASLDTTVWARFAQPAILVHARDAAARADTVAAVADAVATAAGWAVALGPAEGSAADFWRALFAHTYATELRSERAGRGADIVAMAPERYEGLLRPALAAAGLAWREVGGGRLQPLLGSADRAAAARRWARRRRIGKPLNLARLAKAAFTVQGGAAYLAWKVERHSGVRVALTPWQQRHPLLAAPRVLWRLWRQGAIR